MPDTGEDGATSVEEEFEVTRLALVEPALLLAGLESRLAPSGPSSDAKAPAEARGLSVALSDLVAVPGIFDRIDPRNDFEEPCVSDLLKDGYDWRVSAGLFKFVVEPFLGVLEPLLLCELPILAETHNVSGLQQTHVIEVGEYSSDSTCI